MGDAKAACVTNSPIRYGKAIPLQTAKGWAVDGPTLVFLKERIPTPKALRPETEGCNPTSITPRFMIGIEIGTPPQPNSNEED